jgi:ABC-type branched-subunit amino acid transport system ATPase component
MNTFRCERVCKSFGSVIALDELSLQLPTSGVVAIIGPNGAGKTTLINVLTGFASPDSGRCFLGEHDITNLSPYEISRLGVSRTFQNLRLIFQLSVLENVLLSFPKPRAETFFGALLGLGIKKEEGAAREVAHQLLQMIGLDDFSNSISGELSYGQQKLLSMSCCLATGARILLFDEPVAGVHPDMASHILNYLCLIRDEGRLVIFVEHDISAVRQIADLVILMDQGKFISKGTPQEILSSPNLLERYIA